MAKDKSKPRRPRAETPKGFRDYFGAEVRARAAMLARVTEVYHAWGFEPLETSAVETVEALGKFLPDVDRPNQGVFAWQDEDETWLALRYDLTAPLARVYAQHRQSLPTPYRPYQVGPVWRDEKPGPGRFRTSSAPPAWPPTPRSAPCSARRWRPPASPPATTGCGSTTGRFLTACLKRQVFSIPQILAVFSSREGSSSGRSISSIAWVRTV
jgi:hypothetical protein